MYGVLSERRIRLTLCEDQWKRIMCSGAISIDVPGGDMTGENMVDNKLEVVTDEWNLE